MNLFIVGGFLGSGKTTAIIEAARFLVGEGKTVGIVTNDQGKYLVDTAFLQSTGIPTVEVSGGCFCCHYEDLDAVLARFTEELSPDVIFAESVGSCADVIATVLNPLLKYNPDRFTRTVLSVFTDIRLYQIRMAGQPFPFSDEVAYIFDQQILEAEVLVLNKKDLLAQHVGDGLFRDASVEFPEKQVLLQTSRSRSDIKQWLSRLMTLEMKPDRKSLSLDYEIYTRGEIKLAWLDARVSLSSPIQIRWGKLLAGLFSDLEHNLRKHAKIAHLKFYIHSDHTDQKIGTTALQDDRESKELMDFSSKLVSIWINLRAEVNPGLLKTELQNALATLEKQSHLSIRLESELDFVPAKPQPSHRIL